MFKKNSICEFIYKRNINEQVFNGQNIIREKGYKCINNSNESRFCNIHSGIILDRQEYFDEFIEWINQDHILNIDNFSYNLQKDLYKTFMKKMDKIIYLKRLLKIPTGQLDYSDDDYKNIYLNCSNDTCRICNKKKEYFNLCVSHLKLLLIDYYKLITMDLRNLLLNMGIYKYENFYKQAYNEIYVKKIS